MKSVTLSIISIVPSTYRVISLPMKIGPNCSRREGRHYGATSAMPKSKPGRMAGGLGGKVAGEPVARFRNKIMLLIFISI